ncbi:MAG: T9SS type A sorting domain-containing protein [Cyclobacteriaceae bacterium]
MKRHKLIVLAIIFTGASLTSYAQDKKDGKITIEITKEINGEKKTFKGEYENEEQMRADPNYQEFAGDDDSFNMWFGDSDHQDMMLHLDLLKDQAKTKLGFWFSDSTNSFFKHKDADSEDANIIFKLLDDSAGGFSFFRGPGEEEMKELHIRLRSLMEGDDNESHVYVFSTKKIKVTEVTGDEFGDKGEVSKNSKLELEDLTFYPNPSTNGRFKVRFSVPEENELSIKVFNLEGKEVYNRYFERFGGMYSESIDLSGQSEGIYLLEIRQGSKRLTKKIVIDK